MRKKSVECSPNGESQITYLRPKYLLPFFYKSISDKSKSVRQSAVLSIQNFGPQGELMLIEGVTKDKNANVRADCALGLGHIGTQSFRILLIALNDDS